MDGVILYADDHIFDTNNFVNQLFHKLNSETNMSILPINSLEGLERTVLSISTFRALILDWNFKRQVQEEDEGLGIDLGNENPYEFLKSNELYSLVYIYSQEDISDEIKEELNSLYPNKIFFDKKGTLDNLEAEYKKITEGIEKFENDNNHLDVIYVWNKSINKAVQKIFISLNAIDPNWITELYNSGVKDGVNPNIEVINMFQNILSEKIIQNQELKEAIDEVGINGTSLSNPEHYAELMHMLYYGTTHVDDPIMTGDIFKYKDINKYCIIITPECDLRHIAKDPSIRFYEVLNFEMDDYKKGSFKLKANIKASPLIDKAESFELCKFSQNQKVAISQELSKQINHASEALQVEAFTQTNSRLHLLPCFEYVSGNYTGVASIDFRFALTTELANTFFLENRVAKLNTPYVQELRQRFLSYKGRVGVPGYSDTLKKWILTAQ